MFMRKALPSDDCWMKPILTILGFMILFAAPAFARTQSFSAMLLFHGVDGGPKEATGKLFFDGKRVRLELPDFRQSFFVLAPAQGTAVLVQLPRRQFMEARQSTILSQIFVPVDPLDPCRQWRAMAKIAAVPQPETAWQCVFAGEEIDGTIRLRKYRLESRRDSPLWCWIDVDRAFPVRLRRADGSLIDLVSIRDETPDAALFEIPAGFRKFDPEALLERIRQSDVWVEPVH